MRDKGLLSRGLLRNSARRFWPLWLAYAVVLALLFVVPAYSSISAIVHETVDLADKVNQVQGLWTISRFQALLFATCASIIAAVAYNDHLFTSRSATFMGSLPIRREQVFATEYLAGLLPLLAIPAATALCLLPLGALSAGVFDPGLVGQWLALMLALTFVFYSFAQLACQLAGSRAVAVLLYAVINFLAPCLEAALGTVAVALVYGLPGLGLHLEWLSPFAGLAWHGLNEYVYQSVHTGWLVIAGYCLAALAVTTLSCRLFVRRRFEAAGESVIHEPVQTFLKYLAGVSMALLFGTVPCLMRLTTEPTPLPLSVSAVMRLGAAMAVGGFLGVLFAEMILRRSTHVLGRCWKGGLAVSVAALLLVLGLHADVLGTRRRVPDPQNVESVTMNVNWSGDWTVSDPAMVASLCELQRDTIAYGETIRGERADDYSVLGFTYRLADGTELSRLYPLATDYAGYRFGGPATPADLLIDRAVAFANSPEGRAARFEGMLGTDPRQFEMSLEYEAGASGEWQSLTLPLSERRELLEGPLRTDLMEGAAGDLEHNLGVARWDDEGLPYDVSLSIYEVDGQYADNIQLTEWDAPALVVWVREHYPDAFGEG